jgi:hypothetical protein
MSVRTMLCDYVEIREVAVTDGICQQQSSSKRRLCGFSLQPDLVKEEIISKSASAYRDYLRIQW